MTATLASKPVSERYFNPGAGDDASLLVGLVNQFRIKLAGTSELAQVHSRMLALAEETRDAISEGEDVLSMNSASYDQALEFLRLLPHDTAVPDVDIDHEGCFSFDWYYGPRWQFTIIFGSDDTLVFAGFAGRDRFRGRVDFDLQIPDILLGVMAKIVT